MYSVPALAMLVATGCQGDACSTAGVCDDSDACTVDSCTVVDGAAVCANVATVCEGQVCDPSDGECVDCFDDAGCADADFCNGDETCVDSACVAGTDPCAEDESCDEATDECVASCAGDDANCDDGTFCNGAETCNAEGLCDAGTDPCTADQTCDEDNGVCVDPAPDCTSNGDCAADQECLNEVCVDIVVPDCTSNGDCPDDGLFCNGVESCNTNSLACVSSGDPCPVDETCNEDTDACENNNPATSSVLTNLIDLLKTGPGDDTITGTRDGSADGNTISIGDDIDGEGGMDRANFIVTDNSVPAIDMNNVEELYVRSLTAAITIDCSNYNGVDAVAYNNGTSSLTLNSFGALLGVHVIGGDGGTDDFNITFGDDLLDTAAGETMNVTLNGSDIDDLNLSDNTTNNEGPEVINVMGMGGDNVLDDIFSGDGSDDEGATVNITGASNVRINGLNNATVVTGTAATGDLDLTLDPAEDVTVKTGVGNDTIRTAGGLDNDDDIDTGTGTDRVATTSAVTIEDLTAVGVEEWEIGGANTVDFDNTTPALIVMTGNTNTTANNVAKNTPITIYGTTVDNCTINVDGAGSVGSNNDVLTITFGEDSVAANFGGDNLIVPNVETLNFVSMEATNNGFDLDADACATVNVTGDQNLEFDVLAASAALVTVDASGMTGDATLDVDLGLIVQDATVTGTANNDTIICNDNATTDCTVIAGAGADTITLQGITANSINIIAYLSVDDVAADISANLMDADFVGAGNLFDVSEDLVQISGGLRTALSTNNDGNNTAAGAADLDVSGLFFFNAGVDMGADGANADVFATILPGIGALSNETVGDTAVFAVVNSNADDGCALYVFVSEDADSTVAQNELQLLGYFDSDAAVTAANVNLN